MNDFDEYLAAIDDLDARTPLPCATDGCEGHMMVYDEDEERYECPLCGRKVNERDAEDYLYSIGDEDDDPDDYSYFY